MSDFIWVEKYRPTTIDECILPQGIKKTFQDFVTKVRYQICYCQVHQALVRPQ